MTRSRSDVTWGSGRGAATYASLSGGNRPPVLSPVSPAGSVRQQRNDRRRARLAAGEAGGGVGGLALGRGLADSGHRVRVFEQAPQLRTGGAAVTIFSNGAAALAGLGAPLGSFGGRLDTLRFDTADGRTMVTADLTVLARRTGFPVTSVPRYALIEHLA